MRPGAKYTKVVVPRPTHQGVGVDLGGADKRDWREPERVSFSNDTPKLLSDPNGYSWFPELLNPEATDTSEALESTRLHPLEWQQRHFQDASICEWFGENQASTKDQSAGVVKFPVPRAVLGQPFTFKFDKTLKDARVASARRSGQGAVAAAHDDVAVAAYIETQAQTLHKDFPRHLYLYDCAQRDQYALQYEAREIITALAQAHPDKDEATKMLSQFLGEAQAKIIIESPPPKPEVEAADGSFEYEQRETLHHFIGAAEP